MITHLLNGVLPVFAIGALGYFMGKRGIFDFNAAMVLNKFVMFVAMPALGFRLIVHAPLEDFNFAMLGGYFATEAVMYAAGFIIGRFLFGADVKESVLLGLVLALTNHILFVLPIGTLLFGEAAVQPMVAIITMDGLILFSGTLIVMDVLASKGSSVGATFGKIIRNPPVIAMLAGLFVGLLGLQVPNGFDAFADLLGRTASPVLLFALGVILSQPQKNDRPMLPVAITGAKLIVHPVLAWIIFAQMLQLSPEVQTPALMIAAAPCGLMAFMMALNYNIRVDAIVKAILYTSIGSLVTVTLAAGM